MRIWKRLACLALPAAVCLTLLVGCAGEADGVSLSVCVGSAPVTLDPIYAEETGDQTILAHLYENLMRVAVDVSGTPTVTGGMAKDVDQEEIYDGTVIYTFRLRSAKWSDGESVKAGDFVYAWRRLADPDSRSPYAALLSVVAGYDEARATGDMELLQVTAKNDSTLVVVLSGHYDWFLTEVCTSPATMPLRQDVLQKLKEEAEERSQRPGGEKLRWWSDPTALVCNGPYQAESYAEGATLSAKTNERYYSTQAGPKTLVFHFADTAEEARSLYDHKTVDAVWPLTEERLAAFDNLENGEGKRQEYLKALAVVCRTNMLYTWKQEQCPEELDIKKTGLPFRKLKQNSNEELWIREAVEESTGAVIMDGSKEERTVIAIPFFTSSDWEIKIGEAGEGIGLSLNYALLLAQEGSEFTQIIRYFFPESKIRVE